MRDWRSAVITVTVRDQRHREHDPILGVVPLKLSDILETSSQVTRWYPLDGGIGFGRVRISLLFRSIETRLPPHMTGWDVGTFQFTSDTITATDYPHHAKIKMRTGGSIAKIPRHHCHNNTNGTGYYWDVTPSNHSDAPNLPVKYRYRSPVVFEFHLSGKRKADAYAVYWLQNLIDNEPQEIDIPIWRTSAAARLTQNYITEENFNKAMPGLDDLETVGRLKFTGRFKAGMDESHESFVADNDSRETYETWEACLAEGVRQRLVEKELPDRVQALHEQSLTEGRDILKSAEPDEKSKWLAKDGNDWSGAFGEDPKAYTDSKGLKKREPGAEPPLHDPYNPSSDDDSDGSSDLGLEDTSASIKGRKSTATDRTSGGRNSYDTNGTTTTNSTASYDSQGSKSVNAQNKRTEERKQRGLMQWKPARNIKFAKDEGKLGLRKLKNKLTGGLDGRQPGVETETS